MAWGEITPSVSAIWRTIDVLVDSVELEASSGEVVLESGHRLVLESSPTEATWTPANPASGTVWRDIAA